MKENDEVYEKETDIQKRKKKTIKYYVKKGKIILISKCKRKKKIKKSFKKKILHKFCQVMLQK